MPPFWPWTAPWRLTRLVYDGPDLDEVARRCGLSPEAVIAAHLGGDYQVALCGFAPGYAYLSGVPKAIALPRKEAAVRGVAAGSVIIAAGRLDREQRAPQPISVQSTPS